MDYHRQTTQNTNLRTASHNSRWIRQRQPCFPRQIVPPTIAEHQAIIGREKNLERKTFYELCWHLGGSQGDIASLKAEDVDWENRTIGFTRKKTGVPVILHLGEEALNMLKDLPGEGLLFPYLAGVRAGDRATEFKQRCRGLGIDGVSLHSYRYAWAERVKTCGYSM
jgi:integrase